MYLYGVNGLGRESEMIIRVIVFDYLVETDSPNETRSQPKFSLKRFLEEGPPHYSRLERVCWIKFV